MSFSMTDIRKEENTHNLTPWEVYIESLIRAERPILIVEGDQDQEILGWIEDVTRANSNYPKTLSVESDEVGGRPQLLSIFDELHRRNALVKTPVIFVADQDMWVFEGVPSKYRFANEIILTSGYCIENDLYAGVNLLACLEKEEVLKHKAMLDSVIEWFASAVEKRLKKEQPLPKISVGLGTLIPLGNTQVIRRFRPTNQPCEKLQKRIENEHELELPGKLLFQLILRFTSQRQNKAARLTRKILFNTAFKIPKTHRYRDRLINEIRDKLEAADKKIKAKQKFSP